METTTRLSGDQAIEAIRKAMPNWATLLDDRDGGLTCNGDDLQPVALQAIQQIDRRLAYGSETAYLTDAICNVTNEMADADILGHLVWWDNAYQALYLTTPSDGQGHGGALDEDDEPCPQSVQDAIDEHIHTGGSDLALALAERWANEELTADEQEQYGISY